MEDQLIKRSAEAEAEQAAAVIESVGISKKFCRDLRRSLFYGILDIGKELIGGEVEKRELRAKEFWALRNVNVTLRKGESLGLVGKNGCGKTTLMRIMSGLVKPTTGHSTVRGRLAPLLALGSGFNQVLTGRENIYVNMAILGLSKAEIDERFEKVVDFSEIGYALDAPVQSYSSGMAARLGFACAIHTMPDVLLLDEVFAVGDLKFRQKCFGRLGELRRTGMSFILVSHIPSIILGMCSRAVYLKDGVIVADGSPEEVCDQYEEDLNLGGGERPSTSVTFTQSERSDFEIASATFCDPNGEPVEALTTAAPARLQFELVVRKPIEGFHGVIDIARLRPSDPDAPNQMHGDETGVIVEFANHLERRLYNLEPGRYHYGVTLRRLGLVPGLYRVSVRMFGAGGQVLATSDKLRFLVKSKMNLERCSFYQSRRWFFEAVDGLGKVTMKRTKDPTRVKNPDAGAFRSGKKRGRGNRRRPSKFGPPPDATTEG